jgi:hypothetical protein
LGWTGTNSCLGCERCTICPNQHVCWPRGRGRVAGYFGDTPPVIGETPCSSQTCARRSEPPNPVLVLYAEPRRRRRTRNRPWRTRGCDCGTKTRRTTVRFPTAATLPFLCFVSPRRRTSDSRPPPPGFGMVLGYDLIRS